MTPPNREMVSSPPPAALKQGARRMLVIAGPMVLLLSCTTKLVDWSAHQSFVAALLNQTDNFAELIASVIIVIEFVPTALLLARLPRAANLWSLIFFLTATVAWVLASRSISKPTCTCFGQWSQYTLIVEGVTGVLIRNGVFIALTLIGLWFCWRKQPT